MEHLTDLEDKAEEDASKLQGSEGNQGNSNQESSETCGGLEDKGSGATERWLFQEDDTENQ